MDRYDYELPKELIAQQPVEPRHSSRLLDALSSEVEMTDRSVSALPELLETGDVLVLNDSRVVPARLGLEKESGGKVELLLLEKRGIANGNSEVWEALIKPLKRCPAGTELFHPSLGSRPVAVVGERCGDMTRAIVRFAAGFDPSKIGELALPPYISTPIGDPERYQTVYSTVAGSVAAPTAGLHLSESVLGAIRSRGVQVECINLSIGLDTFRPITADRPEEHVIHSEAYNVPSSTMEACSKARRVVAVGTTVVRALETASATGELEGRSELFIHGEFDFKVVDVLMTNFHLPRSSLLLLVESFCGQRWRQIYAIAKSRKYRFLSFGDAMIVGRAG
ncbi:MAG TPA: tRNA preQ1(34) S-adenosylmethionine ribosyltransferase-isomerase QueA [Acidimicrobiales bacterium]|nr:tRNA preQ1(34) S-adenosylmethionine ribosyltransferase-isomerase QueA [Acidimicrobiales bacterium]